MENVPARRRPLAWMLMAVGIALIVIPVLSPGDHRRALVQSVVSCIIGVGVVITAAQFGIRRMAVRITVQALAGTVWVGLCVLALLLMLITSFRGSGDAVVATTPDLKLVRHGFDGYSHSDQFVLTLESPDGTQQVACLIDSTPGTPFQYRFSAADELEVTPSRVRSHRNRQTVQPAAPAGGDAGRITADPCRSTPGRFVIVTQGNGLEGERRHHRAAKAHEWRRLSPASRPAGPAT